MARRCARNALYVSTWSSVLAVGMHCAVKGAGPIFVDERWKVVCRGFIANGAVRRAADEGQVGDVVGFAGGVGVLEHRFGEDVVELQPVLRARVVEGNSEVGAPVLCPGGAERQEHGLEQGAALVAAFQFLWCDVEPSDLQTQAVDQLGYAAALPERGQVLIEEGLAGTA